MDELKRPSGRKVLAMLLVICMCIGLLPGSTITAMADEVEIYTVWFDYPEDFDVEDDEEFEVEEGKCISAPTENLDNGYRKILGWTTERYGTEPYDFSQPVTGYLDLYPILSAYRVEFDDICKTVYVEAGKTVTPPESVAPNGYDAEFKYWYDEDDYRDETPFDFTQPINRDYVLEAKWGQYDVEFEYPSDFLAYFKENDIEAISGYWHVLEGELVEAPKAEWLDNGIRKISGWTVDFKTPYDFSQPVTDDMTLYPMMDKYKVSFYDSYTGDRFEKEVLSGEVVTEPEYEKWESEMYIFGFWYYYDEEDEEHKVDLSTPICRDYNLRSRYVNNYSCYVELYRTLTGADTVEQETLYIKNGTNRRDAVLTEYPIPERFGYTFTGWYYDKACTVECKQGEKLNPTYFYGEDEWYDTGLATMLYAGWIKNDTQEKVEYCEITLRENDEWKWKTFFVEKGSVLGEQRLPKTWEVYSCYGYEMEYFADKGKTVAFDKGKVISEDTTIYVNSGEGVDIGASFLNSYNGKTSYNGNYIKPEREGYTFTGWYYDKDCTYKWHEGTWYTNWSDGKLYAGWQKGGNGITDYTKPNIGYYSLNFSYNYDGYYKDSNIEDGKWRNQGIYRYYYCGRNNFNCNNIYIEKGASAAAYKDTLGDPVIPGHYFVGWYTDKACTIPFDFNTVLTGDTVVYAKWGTNAEQSCITPQNGTQVSPTPAPEQPGNTTTNPTPAPEQPGNTTTNPTPAPEQPDNPTTNPTLVPEKPGNTPANPMPAPEQPDNPTTNPTLAPEQPNGTTTNPKPITQPDNTTTNPTLMPVQPEDTNKNTVPVEKKDPPIEVTSVTLSHPAATLSKGKTITLTATALPTGARNAAIIWESSDNNIAEVKDGIVTAKKAGTATIIARTANGTKASCTVTVAEVFLNTSSTVLKVGTSSDAVKIAEKYPANDTVESYKSSNAKIVTVDKKGKITAGKKTGKATVTITMKSGATVSYKVKVQKKKVTTKKLVLNEKKLILKKGKKVTLQVSRVPISATEKINWSTSDKKIVTVDKKGKVIAKKKGKATITAKAGNGKKATCVITVK